MLMLLPNRRLIGTLVFMNEHQKANAARLRAFRERRRRNAAVLSVEVEPERLTAALRTRGIISAHEQPDRAELASHAAAVVALWCAEPKTVKE